MLEPVFIYPAVIGHPESGLLIDDEGFSWSSRRPKGVWAFRGKMVDVDESSLDELLRLENHEIRLSPGKSFTNSLTGLPEEVTPPWSLLLNRRDYLRFLKNLVVDIKGFQPTDGLKYYNEVWRAQKTVLTSLERFAPPDPEILNEGTPEAMSFKSRGEQCEKITYNRFGTRTGRLTVTSGPRILTLKKELRRHLRSRYDNGVLLGIDFSALEVRLMIAESDSKIPTSDPYLDLSSVMGGMSREDSKLALLSTVYGATEHGLSGSLHTSLDEARRIKETISTRYGTGDIILRLRAQYMKEGFIRNRFGRKVEVPDPGDGALLNSYLQSTGADVSLLGFKEIIDRLPRERATPVAVLHDALILDVEVFFAEKIGGSISVPVPTYEGRFPMKVSQFNS